MNKNFTDFTKATPNQGVATGTCKEVLKNLYLIVDGEATKEQEEYFNRHIEQCIPCLNSYSLEKSVKEFLNSRIEKRPVPQSVLDNIKSEIALIA